MEDKQQGFSWTNLPIYRSLTEYILFMNVPRSFLIWNFGIAAFVLLCFGFDYWLVLAANVTAHFIVRYFSLEDPQFFECFNAYWAKKDYYSI